MPWEAVKPFLTGSMAGCTATCCIQPIDMVKVRIQLGAEGGGATSPITVAQNILRNEGFGAFYQGLSAALTRQAIYTGARLGMYDYFTGMAKDANGKLATWKAAVCAVSAGGLGAIIANPADLALVRMQADSILPPAQQRGYSGIADALASIVRTEGAAGLMGGVLPTMYRAMAQNFGMLAFNSKAKELLTHMNVGSENVIVFGSASIAGFAASVFALPFDFIKTQIQKMAPDPHTGEMPYKGPLDCAAKQFKAGGVLRFYAGFPVFYFRIAPHAMLTLIMQDKIKKFWKSQGL